MLIRIASKNSYSAELVECVAECLALKNRPTALEVLEGYSFLKMEKCA